MKQHTVYGQQMLTKVVDAVIAVLTRRGPSTSDEFLTLPSYGGSGGARETGAAGLVLSGQVMQPLRASGRTGAWIPPVPSRRWTRCRRRPS